MRAMSFHHSGIRTSLHVVAVAAAVASLHRPLLAQEAPMPPAQQVVIIENDSRSGPRFGMAYIFGGSVTAERQGKTFSPLTSLFGWQFEHLFDAGPGLPTPVMEFVVLVGGIEQNRALPSSSFLIGLRQLNGVELGVGPTFTGAGAQLVFAGGITNRLGRLNVPVNLAVAPGRRGASVSLTTGFNHR